MIRTSKVQTGGVLGILLLSGCQSEKARLPVETPQAPAIVSQGPEAEANVHATIIAGQAPAPTLTPPAAAAPERGNITLNLPSADVGVVAKAVLGDILHAQYTVAEGASAQISLVTPGPVSRSALLGLFETSLKAGGLALSSTVGGFLIQPIAAAQASGPVASTALGYGTEIIRLQFINADELKKLLDTVLPGVVTATDPSTNSVTIAGTTGQRKNARDLLAQFDVNWLRNMSFALYVPQRTDSRLLAPELDKLINAPDAPTHGLVRLIPMERLNGIIAISAQPQYLQDVQRWVEILDREGEGSEPRLFVYRVQNGRARDLAKTLNAAFTSGGDNGNAGGNGDTDPFAPPPPANGTPSPNGTPLERGGTAPSANGAGNQGDERSPAQHPIGQGRITADDVNNAVIVFGTPREYALIEDALRKLDVLPYQVLIEAAITEVTLNDDLRYGVQWNFQTGNSKFAQTEAAAGSALTQAAPGFSFFYAGNNISATLNALEQRTNIKVVSAPKLLVLNNQTAALQVGDEVPITTQTATGVQIANAPIVNSVEYKDTGVILKVTPRVNAGGLVLLDVSQEVSDVAANKVSGIDSPTISTRRISTSIAVQDGQVVALGGLFRDTKTSGKDGVPIISRLPVVGGLFGTHTNSEQRTELIVILKPSVVRTMQDGNAITEELRSKIRTLEPFRTSGKIP